MPYKRLKAGYCTKYSFINCYRTHRLLICSGIYVAIVITHVIVCCFGTRLLARLQNLYIAFNIMYVISHHFSGKPSTNDSGFAFWLSWHYLLLHQESLKTVLDSLSGNSLTVRIEYQSLPSLP